MINKALTDFHPHIPGFGMPTLLEARNTKDNALLCHELGLQFIELNMNLPQYQTDNINIEELLHWAGIYDLYYTIHLDENLNVSDFNNAVAKAYRETVYKTIETARSINCPIINMHLSPGVYFTMPEGKQYLFDKYKDHYLQSIVTFRDACEQAVNGSGLHICIENSGGYTGFHQDAIHLLLQSPVFGLTFDIGHEHSVRQQIGAGDKDLILSNSGRLMHMHMHDAIGASHHLPLGTGELPIPDYLKLAAGHRCRIVLETKTIEGLRQSAAWIKTHGF